MNLLIVEDEKILLEKYRSYTAPMFDQVYTASTIAEAKSIVLKQEVSCILSDNVLPDGKGIDFVAGIRDQKLDLPIIIITAFADKDLAISSLNSNVSFFLEKPVAREEITTAIERCIEIIKSNARIKDLYEKFEISQVARDQLSGHYGISCRELEIIQLILHLHSTKSIAQKLFISPGTVKNHLSNIFQKLQISSKEEIKELIIKLNRNEMP